MSRIGRMPIAIPAGVTVEVANAEKAQKKLSVSMKLVFDRSIYIDSSVQPEIESFLSMIKNPYIRQVTFCWGKMYYKGIIKRTGANRNGFWEILTEQGTII